MMGCETEFKSFFIRSVGRSVGRSFVSTTVAGGESGRSVHDYTPPDAMFDRGCGGEKCALRNCRWPRWASFYFIFE